MENIKRVTVGELKKVLSKLPDETLISLQSDSEGNQESTLLDWFVVKIGDEHTSIPSMVRVIPIRTGTKLWE